MARNPNYKGRKQYRVGQYFNDMRAKKNINGKPLTDTEAAFRNGYLTCAKDDAQQHKYIKARAAGYTSTDASAISRKSKPEELKGITAKTEFYKGKKKLPRYGNVVDEE